MPTLTRRLLAWSPAVSDTTARAALEVGRAVASKLLSKETLAIAVEETRRQTAFPRSVQWVPYSVAQGNAGLVLLWAHMDECFPDEEWDLLGREHLELAARELEQYNDVPVSIFAGLAGVAFAAWQLSRGGTRYRRLLHTLDAAIIPRTLVLAQSLEGVDGCSVSQFDAISGLAGIGAYLLCRTDDPACADCLSSVLRALVRLVEPTEGLPRWHTPVQYIGYDKSQEQYPHGWLNCGLAHGIPGPLALLSLAHINEFSVEGLPEAVNETADWLCNNRFDDQWGTNWPTAVGIESDNATGALYAASSDRAPGGPSRCAWCYGSPGVARALWFAGEAVGSERYRTVAVSAIEAVFRRPVSERRIDSPTFCHGVAGLLQIALRFSNDLDSSFFSDDIEALMQQLLRSYSSHHVVGFQGLETGSTKVDQPGFLDGAAGVAAVLLGAATNVPPTWDRLFLLS